MDIVHATKRRGRAAGVLRAAALMPGEPPGVSVNIWSTPGYVRPGLGSLTRQQLWGVRGPAVRPRAVQPPDPSRRVTACSSSVAHVSRLGEPRGARCGVLQHVSWNGARSSTLGHGGRAVGRARLEGRAGPGWRFDLLGGSTMSPRPGKSGSRPAKAVKHPGAG
jgi:hypothetical protein